MPSSTERAVGWRFGSYLLEGKGLSAFSSPPALGAVARGRAVTRDGAEGSTGWGWSESSPWKRGWKFGFRVCSDAFVRMKALFELGNDTFQVRMK